MQRTMRRVLCAARCAAAVSMLLAVRAATAGGTVTRGSFAQTERILNPYYTEPRWRLWTEDSTPVRFRAMKNPYQPAQAVTIQEAFTPTKPEDRRYPVFPAPGRQGVFPVLRHFDQPPAIAGFWDDCYVTLDYGHSHLHPIWSASNLSIGLARQFINVRFGSAPARARLAIGANFTSQSFARRGREIVDDAMSNLEAERDFFFANCIRATPAANSYQDIDAERVYDAYDGLFAHSYQSIGQSGSETLALTKMLIAGGCMSRRMKNLLKRHGAYAIALLTIFKAALPYCDARGNELPYENELRHRPAYSSDGAIKHIHFCGANPTYHGYDDAKHLQRMIDLARNMDVAPPVAILKLVDITVKEDDRVIVDRSQTDKRIQTTCRTSVRIWARRGETITARVDVRDSYDLQGRKLSFSWNRVYPNQRNVRIQPDHQPGLWRITATYDSRLPKGRIPIMLVARNGAPVPSNPAFVNFYWPAPGEPSDWPHILRRPRGAKPRRRTVASDVTQNRRPRPRIGIDGDAVWTHPAERVTFPVHAEDPEGYPVAVYRRRGEVGVLRDGQFVLDVPPDAASRVYPVHLIFSDGTGGYGGTQLKIVACPRLPVLPDEWQATTLGIPRQAGTVRFENDTFHFTGVTGQDRSKLPGGIFAYRKASGDLDLLCQVESLAPGLAGEDDVRAELMIRDQLQLRARTVAGIAVGGLASASTPKCQFQTQTDWKRRTTTTASTELSPSASPRLRLVRRGGVCSGFISTNRGIWEQVGSIRDGIAGDFFAGLALTESSRGKKDGDHPSGATVKWIRPASLSIPVIAFDGKPSKTKDGFVGLVRLTPIRGSKDAAIAYTMDGREPNETSPRFREAYFIKVPGKYELRARVIHRGQLGDVVVHRFRVEPVGGSG